MNVSHMDFGIHPMPLSIFRSCMRLALARSERTSCIPVANGALARFRPPTGCGSMAGTLSVRRKTSASMTSEPCFPSARIRSGTHGLFVGIVRWIGVPSPARWPRFAAAAASKRAAMKIWLRRA